MFIIDFNRTYPTIDILEDVGNDLGQIPTPPAGKKRKSKAQAVKDLAKSMQPKKK